MVTLLASHPLEESPPWMLSRHLMRIEQVLLMITYDTYHYHLLLELTDVLFTHLLAKVIRNIVRINGFV